jgi:hypothetical protein
LQEGQQAVEGVGLVAVAVTLAQPQEDNGAQGSCTALPTHCVEAKEEAPGIGAAGVGAQQHPQHQVGLWVLLLLLLLLWVLLLLALGAGRLGYIRPICVDRTKKNVSVYQGSKCGGMLVPARAEHGDNSPSGTA